MKKISKLIALIVCMATVLTGCGGGGTASGSGGKKILVATNELDTFRQLLVDAAMEEGKARGYQMDLAVAMSADEQVEIFKKAESQGYAAIICIAVDADTALQLEIAAGNLPIVYTNNMPKENYLKAGKYIYTGSAEEDAGAFQAEYVLNKLSAKPELNVMVLKGQKGHSATNGRTSAVKKGLNASGKKINYVFEDYAYWDTDLACEMFKIFNKEGKSVDAVCCNNDNMALGVIKACEELGIDPKSIVICGVDATSDGCAAIEAGTMQYTVCQNAVGQGKATIDALAAVINGKDLRDITLTDEKEFVTDDGLHLYVPFEPVTTANVKDYK